MTDKLRQALHQVDIAELEEIRKLKLKNARRKYLYEWAAFQVPDNAKERAAWRRADLWIKLAAK